MRTLHLTLKKKWFDMILSGEKKEEYREIKRYWERRLFNNGHGHDRIIFTNGYGHHRPSFVIELLGRSSGLGLTKWGAPEAKTVHILKLGKILETSNIHDKDSK